jgi:hypothetical protein
MDDESDDEDRYGYYADRDETGREERRQENADRTQLNTDELIAMMKLDEFADAPLITPVNYAKLYTNMTPQRVYYHLRVGHLEKVICPCGSVTVSKDAADKLFQKGEYDPVRRTAPPGTPESEPTVPSGK